MSGGRLVSRLHVSGGEARGRRLKSPTGIRPTQDVVKQAIFNLLGPLVWEARVLDLFAGSGALGIEALSRGAARVDFVEMGSRSLAILRQNLDALGYADRSRLHRGDAVRWLERNPAAVAEASLVLLDPPYRDPSLARVLQALDRMLGPEVPVVAEHAAGQDLPALQRLRAVRERRYGDSALTVLRAAS